MAEVSTSRQRRLSVAAFGLAVMALVACSQEPTLPPVLSDAERPTAVEIERAPAVEICELNTRPDFLDELVRVHARLPFGAIVATCDGWVLHFSFDEARMKRLSSSEILRTRYEFFGPHEEPFHRGDFDVVLMGRFTKREWSYEAPPNGPPDRQLIVYSIEALTPVERAR
jgi:hypothetical protein